MPPSRLLLTGAAGFLGHYLAREFSGRGWEVHGLDAAPEPPQALGLASFTRLTLPGPALEEAIARVAPAACVHAAGRASVALSEEDPAADFHDGVVVTFGLLDALRRQAPGCRTLLLSSAAVYGDPASLPIREEDPLRPLSPYGFHKLQSEWVAAEFAQVYRLPTASARIFSAYGAGLRRQVVWEICARALRTGSLTLRGTGGESRDFIHAADVAAALALLLEKAPLAGERYNVASGEETTIATLAARLLHHLGQGGEARFGAELNAGDPRNWRADISRLAALGFRPRVPLEEGLGEVAAWARRELAATL